MFKLIWAALVGGNPSSWAIMALVFVIYTGGAVGLGFYEAEHMQAKAIATVAIKAAADQHKADVIQHNAAVASNDTVKGNDAKRAASLPAIIRVIHDLEPATPQNACELSVDVAKQLNAAGHLSTP